MKRSIYLDISVDYTLPEQQIQEQQYNFCCKKVKREKIFGKIIFHLSSNNSNKFHSPTLFSHDSSGANPIKDI